MMNLSRPAGLIDALLPHFFIVQKKQQATMADLADLGAGGTQEYPNYADDEGKNICLAYFVCIWRRPIPFRMPICWYDHPAQLRKDGSCWFF